MNFPQSLLPCFICSHSNDALAIANMDGIAGRNKKTCPAGQVLRVCRTGQGVSGG
ncbi:hypothetical protein ARMA_0256 [Ardenticatena maritima]|uniref:Uncharacterized protein n=1 Tax=Ardenticatena maritima TaxID=872965 RepID=A0A0M8K527_9CHLR|nr:hypothetical protein ARMA_0256 [Ardenticatena maritima]